MRDEITPLNTGRPDINYEEYTGYLREELYKNLGISRAMLEDNPRETYASVKKCNLENILKNIFPST